MEDIKEDLKKRVRRLDPPLILIKEQVEVKPEDVHSHTS